MTFNRDAWSQRHRGQHPLPPRGDRHLCPDCGAVLSAQWYRQIFGCEPGQYGLRRGFTDPSDERDFLVDHRAVR